VDRSYMLQPKRRRQRRAASVLIGGGIALVSLLGWYLVSPNEPEAITGGVGGQVEPEEQQVADAGDVAYRDGRANTPAAPGGPSEKGNRPKAAELPPAEKNKRIRESVEAGKEALEKDDVLTAQVQMSAALRAGATGEEATELRAKLVQLANQVVFSQARVSGDPRTLTYVIKKGDVLRKVAKKYNITDDLIARINNLTNKGMIREGARLKLAQGPFHAVVHKRIYTMDVFLDDVLVRSYRVGLGEHNSTPTGTWRVKNKLLNPTYFPPRGGKIIQADDPNNPLGEHWIGLEGVAGEAKDQLRYGIHGTNEPDSIGKNMSLGCIRLLNEDVQELFSMLVVGHSQVTVKD
jgi:LysM repeat protein